MSQVVFNHINPSANTLSTFKRRLKSARPSVDPLAVLPACTTDVRQWYMQNGLQLNPDKLEALIVGTANQLHAKSIPSSVSVAGTDLPATDHMKVLGVVLVCHSTAMRLRWQGRATSTPMPSDTSAIC